MSLFKLEGIFFKKSKQPIQIRIKYDREESTVAGLQMIKINLSMNTTNDFF